MSNANNNSAGQPEHLCSMISAVVVRCLVNIISILANSKISSLAGLCSRAGRFELYLATRIGFIVTWLIFCFQ